MMNVNRTVIVCALAALPTVASAHSRSSDRISTVYVENETSEPMRVTVDGSAPRTLSPWETVRFTAYGEHASIHADYRMYGETRTLVDAFVSVRGDRAIRYELRPPTVANLTVVNPFPFAITLTCDRGMVRTVEARGRTTYSGVAVGSFHLTARRTTGQRIDDERIQVRPFSGAVWTVDPPSTGLVRLDSDIPQTVRVTLDGRIIAVLPAHGETTVEMPVGVRYVEVRTVDGRLLDRERVDVDPFRTERVRMDDDRYASDHDHDGDRGQHRPDAVSDSDGHAGAHCSL